jgi:hypothetical protein
VAGTIPRVAQVSLALLLDDERARADHLYSVGDVGYILGGRIGRELAGWGYRTYCSSLLTQAVRLKLTSDLALPSEVLFFIFNAGSGSQ